VIAFQAVIRNYFYGLEAIGKGSRIAEGGSGMRAWPGEELSGLVRYEILKEKRGGEKKRLKGAIQTACDTKTNPAYRQSQGKFLRRKNLRRNQKASVETGKN